jgi:hypothetical protein
MTKNGKLIPCGYCKIPFYLSLSRIKVGKKYCSKQCQNKSQIGSPGYWTGKKRPELSETNAAKTMFVKGLTPWNTGIRNRMEKACIYCGEIMILMPSKVANTQSCSAECRAKYAINAYFRDKPCKECGEIIMRSSTYCRGCSQKGDRGPQWRGGVTPEIQIIRESRAYHRWRKAILERDNYTCQGCSQRGGKLHADHIKSFAYYPELRFELSNGRTLCVPCHKQTPNYGYKARLLEGGGVREFQS